MSGLDVLIRVDRDHQLLGVFHGLGLSGADLTGVHTAGAHRIGAVGRQRDETFVAVDMMFDAGFAADQVFIVGAAGEDGNGDSHGSPVKKLNSPSYPRARGVFR